jgi:hypothetical protein
MQILTVDLVRPESKVDTNRWSARTSEDRSQTLAPAIQFPVGIETRCENWHNLRQETLYPLYPVKMNSLSFIQSGSSANVIVLL